MRKQTKLVAVLSTAALLALGASMSSFAAVGWAEENGTWAYYDKNGDNVTDTWAKSGENWFYLDDSGEMATDSLIEWRDNYYYVDANGAMVTNSWYSTENPDYDGEDEPTVLWYYFGSNGKAFTGKEDKLSWKLINGKNYIFDTDGKMQSGWIDDNGKRVTDEYGWKEALYYCGDENDGARVENDWRYLEVEVADLESDIQPMYSSNNVFEDIEQTRWFRFKSNGKKESSKDGANIGGQKYSFDAYGRMNAEWATKKGATPGVAIATTGNATAASAWRYYNSPEDGKLQKGWFQVVPDERLNGKDYSDDKEVWYYSTGKELVVNQIKEIGGKRYIFDGAGKMHSGLLLVTLEGGSNKNVASIVGTDDFADDIDMFADGINTAVNNGADVYYFGKDSSDGAMKSGTQTVEIDGENYAFDFGKSKVRAAGKHGYYNKKYYQGGRLLKASKEEKYVIVVGAHDKADRTDTLSLKDIDKYKDIASGTSYVVVNTSGSVQKNKTVTVDDYKYTIDASGKITKDELKDK